MEKTTLQRLYQVERKSMKQISQKFRCSVHKIEYWLRKHDISRRSISDAIYQWHHPRGDPFLYRPPCNSQEFTLFGMGLGLYWGEGTKANKTSVRLGNTDPALLHKFIEFLVRFFAIERKDLRFGLQLFNDIHPQKALDFWTRKLKLHKRQFYKITVTPSVSHGTYRRRSLYGVLTVYYNNRKLRDILIELVRQQAESQAALAQR
ncbi:MAG: hypothetical protein AAB489_02690 [Patescibacteria group bacterium]